MIRTAIFAAGLAALCVSPALSAGTLVTVGGAVTAPNRPAQAADVPSFFRHHEIAFENGRAFDYAALRALGMHEVTATDPATGATGVYSGPLLSAVMADAGASDKSAWVTALDGYAAEISPALIAERAPILAIDMNGAPLDLGGFGPAMVVFDKAGLGPDLAKDLADKEVWAVFYIRAD